MRRSRSTHRRARTLLAEGRSVLRRRAQHSDLCVLVFEVFLDLGGRPDLRSLRRGRRRGPSRRRSRIRRAAPQPIDAKQTCLARSTRIIKKQRQEPYRQPARLPHARNLILCALFGALPRIEVLDAPDNGGAAEAPWSCVSGEGVANQRAEEADVDGRGTGDLGQPMRRTDQYGADLQRKGENLRIHGSIARGANCWKR
jgi:hypothetical protein